MGWEIPRASGVVGAWLAQLDGVVAELRRSAAGLPGRAVERVRAEAVAEAAALRGGRRLEGAAVGDVLDGVAVAGFEERDVAFGRALIRLQELDGDGGFRYGAGLLDELHRVLTGESGSTAGLGELVAWLNEPDPDAHPLARAVTAERALTELGPWPAAGAQVAELLRTLVLARGVGLPVAFGWYDAWRSAEPLQSAVLDCLSRLAEVRRRLGRAGRCWEALAEVAGPLEFSERQAAALFEVAWAGRVRLGRYARAEGIDQEAAAEDLRYLQRMALLKPEVPDAGYVVAGPRFPAAATSSRGGVAVASGETA
ncbi:hypothetical protein [Streptomyces sp. TLI_171]|uniref:hypothetical protein n=1 Tax=Streptomyces sp. TLI_171 TaxID=1938859 RepID=UPI000C18342D|nr:hypothetical protein [Streptomyces sp. TLI_171]RKE18464.1 hypothetical protein BX266_1754 [Streptomyces sp. TLI_171]